MLYEIPLHNKELLPEWGNGIGGIQARLPNGSIVSIPVLEATSVLTVGIVGSGKSRSYTLPAARYLLATNPMMKGVFFETKRTFLEALCRRMTRSSPMILPLCLHATCFNGA